MLALVVAALFVLFPSSPSGQAAHATIFGFNDDAAIAHELSPSDDAALLAGAGANSARITIDWSWVQPKRHGRFQMGQFDSIYGHLLARGIRPLIVVTGAPAWARSPSVDCPPSVTCHAPPTRAHNRDWMRFVATVARRYRRAVAIEIWNEPNTTTFFQPRPNAARYTQLLRLGRAAIKTVAPRQVVLGASLAGDLSGGQSPQDVDVRTFLSAMYQHGAARMMDGISIHPYPGARGIGQVYDVIDTALEVRDDFRDSAPLWITEIGVSTTGPDATPGLRAYRESVQAQVLGDLIPRLMRRPDVTAVYVHELRDPPNLPPTSVDAGYGLLRADGSRKPSYCAVARARGQATDCTPPVAVGGQVARWDAQERVQGAVEAALAHHRDAGTYRGLSLSQDSGVEVHEQPGGADSTQLCDRADGGWTYCITTIHDAPWQFTLTRPDGSSGSW